MQKKERELLNVELDRHKRRIESLADIRLTRLKKLFDGKFREHSLTIMFGNGSELVEVDGHAVKIWDTPPIASMTWEVINAIKDVREITDCYRLGCPTDVKIS